MREFYRALVRQERAIQDSKIAAELSHCSTNKGVSGQTCLCVARRQGVFGYLCLLSFRGKSIIPELSLELKYALLSISFSNGGH